MQSEVDTRARLVIVGVIVVALFTGLLTRLWFLQVGGGEQLAVAAQQQRESTLSIPALRGAILDAKGRVLAETVVVTSLTVDRQNLDTAQRKDLVAKLAFVLGKDPKEIDTALDSTQYAPYEPVPIATLTQDQNVFFAEHKGEFPHTQTETVPVRTYPNGSLGAHVVGYLGRINQAELDARPDEGYQVDDTIGKDGIELTYESELRGTPGIDTVQLDARGQATSISHTKKPVAGHDVQLSIDLDAQRIAQESLQQGIDGSYGIVDKVTGRYHEPKGGAVVVLDARTGQVVALASNPTYDPNTFILGGSDQYLEDANHPLIDRAVYGGYPPGSTFKLFSAIASTTTRDTNGEIIRPADESFNDEGCYQFGNAGDERCNAGSTPDEPSASAYGIVDLARALTVSSDVYFYDVGNEFWNNYNRERIESPLPPAQVDHPIGYGIQDVAKSYGFAEPTGVELPGDSSGRIPDLSFNRSVNKCDDADKPHAEGADSQSCTWRRGDSASLAVGQGDVLVTPLQLADGYAAFANGGLLNTPQLVASVRGSRAGLPAGELGPALRESTPKVKRTLTLDPGVHAAIRDGLHGVVNDGEGTAYAAFRTFEGPTVMGKTGTAQNQGRGDTSWFAGVYNADNDLGRPQYVVVAMVEEGGFGADVSAPIVRRVMDYLNGDPNPAPVDVQPYNPNKREDQGD